MKIVITKNINLIVFIFALFLNFSCSQDSDLLVDNVLEKAGDIAKDSEGRPTGKNIYYVTTSGTAISDGVSEETAWSIVYAFNTAKAGDIVYIKAGNYGAVNLKVNNSGYEDSPIQFIGYKEEPGDIKSVDGSTVSYKDYKNNGDKLDPEVMPLLEGKTKNSEGQGLGLLALGKNLVVENIQVSNYEQGLSSYGIHNKFNNIIVSNIGDFNPNHTYPISTKNASLNYKGMGINLKGDYTELKNSIVINSGAEGIKINNSKKQLHENNKVYSDSHTNPTDYYYLVTNESSDNIIRKSYIERVGKLAHNGHGLVLKVSAFRNLFENVTVKNTSIECSFSGVYKNVFNDCKLIGGSDKKGSIVIANGAHHNTFNRCSIDNADGVNFMDWKDNSDVRDTKNAGNNNSFILCEFSNLKSAINFHWWSKEFINSPAHNNKFIDCKFINLEYLFMVDRANYDNEMSNCIIENVKNLSHSVLSKNDVKKVYFKFYNTKLVNTNFKLP